MLALSNTREEEAEPLDALSAAMKKLINFDRIDEPAVDMRLTMMQKEEKKKTPNGKSRGLPPLHLVRSLQMPHCRTSKGFTPKRQG
jgi:hypothetical protein